MEKEKPKRIYSGRQVNVRLTDAEYGELETKVKAAGLTVPYVVKKAVTGKRIPPKKPPKINDEIALSMASELRRIGTNINQIAKHLNNGRNVLEDELESIRGELEKIWRTLN